ncbi:PilZ domain-containing protein [Desulfuromonas sp.]|uniref:PilZ domain-containing protein n=1 Tax=Desulfuromonas sp. TaxID=892 RepID=UPI0025B9329C|nr:PilZ domain-containing protein [Desulfuromonas sp.]
MRKEERRAQGRFHLRVPATVIVGDGSLPETLHLITTNLSSKGVFLKAERPLSAGSGVAVKLIIRIEKLRKFFQEDYVAVNLVGKVLRTEEQGMAVGFDNGYSLFPFGK